MKTYILFLAVIFFVGCKAKNPVGPNGVTYTDGLQYSNYITDRQSVIIHDIMDYGNASKISIDEADKSLDKTIADVTDKLKDIEGMPAFNGDSSFRNAIIDLFRFYKASFSSDFKDMHALKRKVEAGTATGEDSLKLQSFGDVVGEKERPLDAKVQETQMKFAKDNNILLKENSAQSQLDDMKKGK